jgi:hypothetical protein
MWPKPRQPTTATAYHPIRDAEQQHDTHNPSQPPSLWPTAPIPPDKLLSANSALKPSHLLNGDNKINQSLLLSGGGGNKPIAEHLLLQPRFVDVDEARERKERVLDEDGEDVEDEFEHLDYLEATDDMPLTSTITSRRSFRQGLRRVSLRSAFVGATVVVVVVCLIVVVGVVAAGGKEHELGPGDYKS